MPKLSGSQIAQLRGQLLDAFRDPGQWDILVSDAGHNRAAISVAPSLTEIAQEVIEAANSQGWIADLLRAAANLLPDRPDLREAWDALLAGAASGAASFASSLPRSNIPSMGGRPLVGRDDLLDRMRRALGQPGGGERILALHGQPGVGKSELAREYARREAVRYPGGTFIIDASAAGPPAELAVIGQRDLGLSYPADLGLRDRCIAALYRLGEAPSLLIYDNAGDFAILSEYLPPAGMPVHAVLTTVHDPWQTAWPEIHVPPLDDPASRALIRSVAGAEVAEGEVAGLAAEAGGLPAQLTPGAAALKVEAQRGRRRRRGLAGEAASSFGRAFALLGPDARLLLLAAAPLNPQGIPAAELAGHMAAAGWGGEAFDAAVDACLDLHWLEGSADLRGHQLRSGWLLALPPDANAAAALAAIRAAQAARLVAVAAVVKENPADAARAALLAVYPAEPEAWDALRQPIGIEDGETVGEALVETGRFADARPWHERAVAAKEKGDADGRVDHDSLGSSLHGVGYCLSSTGGYAAARSFYERAAEEAAKGDIHGHIDHESLGMSLHQVGVCLSETRNYAAARSFYERAADEHAKGDIHGHIDHESLGTSLHQVGVCLSETRDYAAARPFYERAADEHAEGDIHGRIDHKSLGRSLHQVGVCLSETRDYAAARSFYERAAEEKAKGDIHGRIDHESLGRSLHGVGVCLSSTGDYAAARPFYERAAAEHAKGDIHGRIDHASLGSSLHQVGYCRYNEGEIAIAFEWIERAVAAKRKGDIFGRVNRASLAVSLGWGATMLRTLGRADEAAAWDAEAEGLGG